MAERQVDNETFIKILDSMNSKVFSEFIRGKIVEIYNKMTNVPKFCTQLYSDKVLAKSEYEALEGKSPLEKVAFALGNVMSKTSTRALVVALNESNNEDIIVYLVEACKKHEGWPFGVNIQFPKPSMMKSPTECQVNQKSSSGKVEPHPIVNSFVINGGQQSFVLQPTQQHQHESTSAKQNVQQQPVKSVQETDRNVSADGGNISKGIKKLQKDEGKKIKIRNANVLMLSNRFEDPPLNLDSSRIKEYKYLDEKNGILRIRNLAAVNDENNMRKLFKDTLKFNFTEQIDLTSKKVKSTISLFKEDCIEKQKDACIVIVSTHGGSRPFDLIMNDLEPINVYTDLVHEFTRDKFKFDAEKPIIFFINSCQKYTTPQEEGQGSREPKVGPRTIIAFSTIPYKASYRDDDGSFYLSSLYKEFSNNYQHKDLVTMLDAVAKDIRNRCRDMKDADGITIEQHANYKKLFDEGVIYFKPQ